ncbi:MAG: hypothetical protein JNL05_15590 [Flavobacteriales bacterium]|nr:hypothetical protein [Flavobacteriales bacterium]
MERREHYDPEDIEQLLMERGFDELLEEERAYVLRHLSGRDEYESMRRLLMEVQRTEPDHDLLEADLRVRNTVMGAFRERNRPQWQVWLNSVGAWMLPRDASAIWRPALAVASLAAVIGLSVWYLNGRGSGTELAEVRPEAAPKKERPAPPPSTDAPAQGAVATEAEVAVPTDAVPIEQAQAEEQLVTGQKTVQAATAAEHMDVAVAEAPAEENMDDQAFDVATTRTADAAKPTAGAALDSVFQTRQLATNSGYLNNWSMANASGTSTGAVVVAKEARERSKRKAESGKDAEPVDDRTLALLRAAW